MIKLLSVADLITLLNAVLGFCGLLLVFSNELRLAASLILLGLLADGLDGIIARRFGPSHVGEFLEPLADMISLSVAPLALVYKTYSTAVASQLFLHILFGAILVFSLICSIIRLSSFSLLKEKHFFLGLPTSASAIVLVVLSFLNPDVFYLLPVVIVLSLAMISSIRFPKPGLGVNLIAAVFILATIILDNMFYHIAPLLLLTALLCYMIIGPIFLYRKKKDG
jgi:CDP-diacylglycerol--serine O-phosphatidyltransferase